MTILMTLEARFQKLRGGQFSEGQGGGKFSEGLDPGGLPCFSANVLFLWQYCYQLFISLCLF